MTEESCEFIVDYEDEDIAYLVGLAQAGDRDAQREINKRMPDSAIGVRQFVDVGEDESSAAE